MSRRRKYVKRKGRKRLAIGVIAVTFILACFFAYSSLRSSPPKAAIVDHLSFFPEQRNQTFVDACVNILEEDGLTWAYHGGGEVTVNFYRKLPSYGTSLIILRVHSAIMKTEEGTVSILGLFTSERYYGPADAYTKYPEDVEDKRLVEAFFSPEERAQDISYLGIVPRFIEKSMEGEFKNTIIIMMGCEGLGYDGVTYTDMAEAFVKKGAKVYIGWDGPVGVNHTDQATINLLESLIIRKRTIKGAITETMGKVGEDPTFNSTLKYHPKTVEVEKYTILNIKGVLTMNVAATSPTPRAAKRSKILGTW